MRVILIIRFPYMQSVEYRLKHGHNESFAAQQQRDAIYQREQESAEHQPQEGVPCLGTAYRDRAPRKAACRNRTEQNTYRIDRRANANQKPAAHILAHRQHQRFAQ